MKAALIDTVRRLDEALKSGIFDHVTDDYVMFSAIEPDHDLLNFIHDVALEQNFRFYEFNGYRISNLTESVISKDEHLYESLFVNMSILIMDDLSIIINWFSDEMLIIATLDNLQKYVPGDIKEEYFRYTSRYDGLVDNWGDGYAEALLNFNGQKFENI